MAGTLHLRCGRDIRDALIMAKIDGDFAEWGDPICEGPAPGGLTAEAYEAMRVDFISRFWHFEPNEVRKRMEMDRRTLAELDRYDRIVLWFEHDLYDQCILVQLLAALPDSVRDRVELVCVGSFPSIDRFIGLGQLQPEQLASLLPTARRIDASHIDAAVQARLALMAPSPEALHRLLDHDACGPLVFLPRALQRHLEELPWINGGLGLTDRLILQAIGDGATTAVEVFHAWVSALDPQPYLGDLMFWAHLDVLAHAPRSVILLQGEFPAQAVSLTDFGQAVQREEADFFAVNGAPRGSLHRWRGGLEQRPEDGQVWRWDPTQHVVVACDR